MSYPSCVELTNIDATCDAVKKIGGVAASVYIGSKKSFYDNFVTTAMPIIEYDTTNFGWILEFDSAAILGTELAKFTGIELKNSGSFETVPAENVNVFTHNLNLVLFHYTQEELAKLTDLLLSEDLFAIVATNAGEIKVYGLERGKTYSPLGDTMFTEKKGLQPLTGTGTDLVEIQGEVGVSLQLQALNLLNPPYYLIKVIDTLGPSEYNQYADMLTQIDTLSENNG
jgi:hypothetical protein